MNITQMDRFDIKCTGCHACFNVCPASAISMRADGEGFLYPVVDNSLCLDCGKCVEVCSIGGGKEHFLGKCLWGYVKDSKERAEGSSGGIFGVLAQSVIDGGGVIYGAAVDSYEIIHCHAETADGLKRLKGSKYVQSIINDTFQQAKRQLDSGRKVLFSGTPCQIKGFRRFLGGGYDNLLTVDFVCHGVPSPKLYADMLKQSAAEYATFREKPFGWYNQVVRLYRGDKLIKTIDSHRNFYFLSFVYNYSLRKSCYFCGLPDSHVSDITLGDNWTTPRRNVTGESLIMLNTNHGRRAFDALADKLITGEIIDTKALSACFMPHDLIKVYDPTQRDVFYAYYTQNGYANCEKHYMNNELKDKKRKLSEVLMSRISYYRNK